MKELFKKTASGLIPDTEEGMKLFSAIGEYAMVEFIKGRSYENHKRFFKFLDVAFDMQEFYDDKEDFRKSLQMLAGHYDELIILGRDGGEPTVHYTPKSICFEAMDELEFEKLFKRCRTQYLSRYGTGMTEDELMRVIRFD
jgi:hypothetical protein